jgi:hypothetical protein
MKYVVYVLWLKGHSLTTIGHWTKLREKQLAGIITRSPWPNRSDMTDAARGAALVELQAIRKGADGLALDGGMFDRIDWTPLPLTRDQVRG